MRLRHTAALSLAGVLLLSVGCAPLRRANVVDAAYFATGAADLYTTHEALEEGLHESNPLLQWTDDDPLLTIAGGAAIKVGFWFLVDYLHARGTLPRGARNILLGFASGAQGYAAWHNHQLTLEEIEENRTKLAGE